MCNCFTKTSILLVFWCWYINIYDWVDSTYRSPLIYPSIHPPNLSHLSIWSIQCIDPIYWSNRSIRFLMSNSICTIHPSTYRSIQSIYRSNLLIYLLIDLLINLSIPWYIYQSIHQSIYLVYLSNLFMKWNVPPNVTQFVFDEKDGVKSFKTFNYILR